MCIRILIGLMLVVSMSASARAQQADVDSSSTKSSLREQLQQEDADFFEAELLEVNSTFKDSVLAQHDELGLDAFESRVRGRGRRLSPVIGLAGHLNSYNRVDGTVTGVSGGLRSRRGPELFGEIGYAWSAKEWRHYSEFHLPFPARRWETDVRVHYGRRVQHYGSNDPTLNAVRFLVGGADDRDYLLREGGGVEVAWFHESGISVGLGYEAAEDRSIGAHTDFSFLGDPAKLNADVDEGIGRSLVGRLSLRTADRRLALHVTERVSGGQLGGDFTFNRLDASLRARRYLLGRHEFVLQAALARTGGTPPVQRTADVGGLSTVRGFSRRSRVGQTALAGRLEYPVPWDLFGRARIPALESLGLQLVPWADAGRVWNGDSDQWIHSAGIGVQRFLGPFGSAANLRLDVAFPLGPDREDDVRVLLRFAPGLQ